MSEHQATFIDLVLRGEALSLEIDDYVDQWHEMEGEGTLREFLGMSEKEYQLWLRIPEAVDYIVTARKLGKDPEEVRVETHDMAIAARSDDVVTSTAVTDWLHRKGLTD